MKVVRRFSQYRGESMGEFASWLRSILRSALVDLVRHSHSSRKEMSLDDLSFPFQPRFTFKGDKDNPEAEAIRNEEETLLLASALFLPEQDCNIVLLRFWDGLPYKEIGRRVHCSPDAARMRFRRSIDEIALFWRDTP